MLKAYCSNRKCDPKQLSARGVMKPNALPTQTTCECGGLLVWYDPKTKYRASFRWTGSVSRKSFTEPNKKAGLIEHELDSDIEKTV